MQSAPQDFVLQRQLSPQPQLGPQAQPVALEVLRREADALFIFVSVDQALVDVRQDTPYLIPGMLHRLNETATTFRARLRVCRTCA